MLIILSIVDLYSIELDHRPTKMLERYLGVVDATGIQNAQSRYSKHSWMEYTAWIYFEATDAKIRKIIENGRFRLIQPGTPNQGLQFADFPAAPELPSDSEATIYMRDGPTTHNIEYIVTESDHRRLWFVSLDY